MNDSYISSLPFPSVNENYIPSPPANSQKNHQTSPYNNTGYENSYHHQLILRRGRPPKPCKANLIREIIHKNYWLKVDANGLYFLEPHQEGPVLILEAEMVSPIIKQMAANYSNRDISEQSIRDALDIIRRDHPEFSSFGTGRTWLGINGERYIALNRVVMRFPFGQENMSQPNYHHPYWHPINSRPYPSLQMYGPSVLDPAGIRVIESYVSLPKERDLLVYTYLLLCLMPERQQLALELTGEPKSGMSRLQIAIKRMVDPVIKEEVIREIPVSTKELDRQAWRHHVINFENVESSLGQAVQRRLYELLMGSRLEWKAIGCHENTSCIPASRACMLSSLEPVITHHELVGLTLSLEMPPPSTDRLCKAYPQLPAQDSLPDEILSRAFNALLGMLGKVHAKMDQVHLDRKVPDSWQDFCRIGMVVSDVLTGSAADFWFQYEGYRNERLCEMTEEEPVAQAIVEYLKINDITETIEKPAGVWLAILSEYRPVSATEKQWPRDPRGLGAAFKRAAPLLEAQGIACYSNGKRGSKRHWVIGKSESPWRGSASEERTPAADEYDFF